uniref:ligand-binding sensor domain-containing protein n=1 Tax=Nocardia suismassiliense TaxID=2077092 RepID=UPI003F495171
MGELVPRRNSAALARNEVRELMREFLEEADGDEELSWDSFTVKDGLPHNWVFDIFVDSTGRVWAGTWGGGVGVYHHGAWKSYDRRHGLSSNDVTCIREDSKGRIWAATSGGVNRFENDRFVDAGLTGNSLLNMTFDHQDNLWVGCWRHTGRTAGGLYVAENAGKRATSALGELDWQAMDMRRGTRGLEVLKVFEDSRGRIWVGTYNGGRGEGVGCWDGSRWRRFTTRDGLVGDCVYSMFEDPDGRMWFGTTNGVAIYDDKVWRTLTTRDGLRSNQVYAMFIDDQNKMWFGTRKGVSRFDGKNWKAFTRRKELPAKLVRTIAQDNDGSLWFGTYPFMPGRGGIGRAKKRDIYDKLEGRMTQNLLPGNRNKRIGS